MKWFTCALALVLTACQGEEHRVVARVGHRQITVQEYDQMAAKLLQGPYRNLQQIDQEARLKLLDGMIAKELLIQAALTRRLDQDSSIAPQVNRLEENLLIKALYERAAKGANESTDPEVELYFYEGGFDQEIRVSAISCETDAEAEQVLAALRQGIPFEILATQRPHQPPGSRQGGDLGFMPPADLLPEVRSQLLSLEPGQVYPEPLSTRYGLQVVKVSARRTVDYPARQAQMAERLRREKRAARIAAYTASLKQRFDLNCNTTLIDRLANDPASVAPDENICTWTGGALSADEYRQGEGQNPREFSRISVAADTAALRGRLEEKATRKLLVAAARRQGYLDEQIQALVRQERDELLVARLFAEVVREVTVSEEERQAYYQAHLEEYGARPAIDVQEILVEERALAEQLRQRLEGGEDMAELADRYNIREATRQRRGLMRLWRRENAFLGPLAPAALDAEIGVLYGPLKVPGGFSLFRVTRRLQLPARPFEEVRQGITAILKAERQNEAMDRFLEDLKAINKAAIAIYPEVLTSTLRDYRPVVAGGDSLEATEL